ncbi:hypothetical protein TNCV_3170131 [Trichonephila clavipes]|nr:hypothetical protein TNCV_3170131 [Trichonephila clavipes]
MLINYVKNQQKAYGTKKLEETFFVRQCASKHSAPCRYFDNKSTHQEKENTDGRPELPNLELAPEMAWNLFTVPGPDVVKFLFGGVRQESSCVKKVH